jgi:hypothetical protein
MWQKVLRKLTIVHSFIAALLFFLLAMLFCLESMVIPGLVFASAMTLTMVATRYIETPEDGSKG